MLHRRSALARAHGVAFVSSLVAGLLGSSVASADHLPPVDPLVSGGDHTHENHAGHVHADEVLGSIDLSDADFSSADLSEAFLGGAILVGANLSDADLAEASFNGADFTGSDLTNANLTDAEWITPTQIGSVASLAGATLSGLNLWQGSFGTLDFTATDLRRVDLRGADLGTTTGLGAAIASTQTWYDAFTTFPAGFDPVAAGWLVPTSSNLYGEPTLRVSNLDEVPGDLIPPMALYFSVSGFVYGGAHSINDAGVVAFRHNSAPGDNSYGVFRSDGTSIENVAAVSDPAPGGAGSFSPFFSYRAPPEITDAGDVFFYQQVVSGPPGVGTGIFAETASGLRAVALELDPFPGVPGGAFEEFGKCVGANFSGDVVFNAWTFVPTGGSTSAAFKDSAGVIAPIFVEGAVAPGTGGGTYLPYGGGMCPDINDAGEILSFVRFDVGGTASEGLFSDLGGVQTALVLAGDVAPGTGGGTFEGFATGVPQPMVRLNDAGDIAFRARVTGGTASAGIFMLSGGVLRKVAAEGDPAPGTGTVFDYIASPRLNENGDVAFYSSFDGGEGIFFERDGVILPVALTGEPAPAAIGGFYLRFGAPPPLSNVGFIPTPDLNDAGQIAFAAYTTEASVAGGIFVVPEPSATWMLIGGFGVLTSFARRRT